MSDIIVKQCPLCEYEFESDGTIRLCPKCNAILDTDYPLSDLPEDIKDN